MRAYADSSFILRLITSESGSEAVIAQYRHLGKPALFFLPVHNLEVRNAILQRAFHQRHALGPHDRRQADQQRDAGFGRLAQMLSRRSLLDVLVDMDALFTRANALSLTHTERIGARAIDVLHVAAALTLASEVFLTTDVRQSELARAEGLVVPAVEMT